MGAGWKDIVRMVAPALATALGGQAAGIAVRQMGDRLLGKPDATEAEIEALVLAATPEQLKALKELDNEFTMQMADLGVKLEEIEAGDRANARDREKVTHDPTPHVLAYIITAGVFGLAALLATVHVPPENRDQILALLGAFSTVWIMAMSYYFGTTNQSRVKDAVIGRVAEKK